MSESYQLSIMLMDELVRYGPSDVEHIAQLGREAEVHHLPGATAVHFWLGSDELNRLIDMVAPLFAQRNCSISIDLDDDSHAGISVTNMPEVLAALQGEGVCISFDQFCQGSSGAIAQWFEAACDEVEDKRHASATDKGHLISLRPSQDQHWLLSELELPQDEDDDLMVDFYVLEPMDIAKLAAFLQISHYCLQADGVAVYDTAKASIEFGPYPHRDGVATSIELLIMDTKDKKKVCKKVIKAFAHAWYANFSQPLYFADEDDDRTIELVMSGRLDEIDESEPLRAVDKHGKLSKTVAVELFDEDDE